MRKCQTSDAGGRMAWEFETKLVAGAFVDKHWARLGIVVAQ